MGVYRPPCDQEFDRDTAREMRERLRARARDPCPYSSNIPAETKTVANSLMIAVRMHFATATDKLFEFKFYVELELEIG
jgi:hypothetical protein